MRGAIIDLGTNTFNLLIADKVNGKIVEILREKRSVKIGKDGLSKKIITPNAYERAIQAIKEYKKIIDKLAPSHIKIVATSAFRSTENSNQLASEIEQITNVKVEIIDGIKEAEYIYYGIREAVPLTDKKMLMLDIGGGSNELIIGNKHEIFWTGSFNLGIQRLIEMFQPHDPLYPKEMKQISEYIKVELSQLQKALLEFPTDTLIGSSGSFDTIANILHIKQFKKPLDFTKTWNEINLMQFGRLLDLLIISSYEQRKDIQGMDITRIEMMPIASLFIRTVLEFFKCKRVIHSLYAIKEGVWFNMFK